MVNFAHALKTEAYILFITTGNAALLQACWFEGENRPEAAGHDDDDDDELHTVTATKSELLSVSFAAVMHHLPRLINLWQSQEERAEERTHHLMTM